MAFEVPPLPYDYDALEPTIDEQTMRLHHDKHHQAYVDNANKALDGTQWADRRSRTCCANLDALPEDKQAAGAQQRRRPREPLAVLGDHGPGRRRRAERRRSRDAIDDAFESARRPQGSRRTTPA